MMILVGIQLGRRVVELRGWELALALATAAVSVGSNMAVGFVVGLGPTHLLRALSRRFPCSYSRRRES